jgi:hypothetical protein
MHQFFKELSRFILDPYVIATVAWLGFILSLLLLGHSHNKD